MPLDSQIKVRSGERVRLRSYVVDLRLWGEGHKRVVLLSPGSYKISCQARYAARSVKRFGAALQVFNQVEAHLKIPKDGDSFENWSLEKVELQNSFLSLRSSYAKIETASFAFAFVRDLLPLGQLEEVYYSFLGEFLSCLDRHTSERPFLPNWWKLMFWSLCFRQMGYGNLLPYKEFNDCQCFEDYLSQFESASIEKDFGKNDLARYYVTWREKTHQSWDCLEKCLRTS